jgi:hypothetical protein
VQERFRPCFSSYENVNSKTRGFRLHSVTVWATWLGHGGPTCSAPQHPISRRTPSSNSFSLFSAATYSRGMSHPTPSTSPRSSNALTKLVRRSPARCASKSPPSRRNPPSSLSTAPIATSPPPAQSSRENFSPETGPSSWRKSGSIARTVGGPFSPNRPRQRLNHRHYSPAVLTIAVTTATAARSFEEAAKLLEITAELKVSPRHLQTLCQEVGGELVAKQQARTTAYRERPLMTPPKQASPPIPLAVVMIDGGRIQTRQPENGPGVHQPAWKEDKTAILLRMTRTPSAVDPQPQLPACFAQPLGTPRSAAPPPEPLAEVRATTKPESLFRTGLATMNDSEAFGWMTAAAAEDRGFFTAATGAFVSDGLAYNWSIHRRHFAAFEPILDFVHAAEHVHDAAKAAGGGVELGRYWAGLCWQGRVQEVLGELEEQRSRLTPPPRPDEEPEHPWCVLSRECGYLGNNQQRMDYPRYRREGLPMTSSPVESWVKQLNQRVKGSEKFWNEGEKAENMLHLRTAWLSDDDPLMGHLKNRPGHPCARPTGTRSTSIAA